MKRAICLSLVLLCVSSIFAEFPKEISFQGKMQHGSGTMTGYYDMTFRIYESEATGSPIWIETHANVHVLNSLFNVYLGSSGSPLTGLNFDTTYWIEVSVFGVGTFLNRYKLGSSPYAFRSAYADSSIRCVTSSSDPSQRTGVLNFVEGDYATLTDTGDTINIEIDGIKPLPFANHYNGWSNDISSATSSILYSVPPGCYFYLYGATMTISNDWGSTGTCLVNLEINSGGLWYPVASVTASVSGSGNAISVNFDYPIYLDASEQIRVNVPSIGTGSSYKVAVTYWGWKY